MVEWLALWGTGLVCYVADTQYWFCLGCFVLGSLLALQQRGWRAITLAGKHGSKPFESLKVACDVT